MNESLGSIFLNAALINNFVLAYFLGICPFLGVSAKLETATRMGAAVTFVMLVSSICAFGIHRLLVAIDAPYLELISFIAVIASTVQLVEMFVRKASPALFRALGIFLPLITTNCAVLGVAVLNIQNDHSLLETTLFGFAGAVGFGVAILLFSGIRELLDLADTPAAFKGTAIALVTAGILSLAFMGFAGLV